MRSAKPSQQRVVELLLELAQGQDTTVEQVVLFGSHGREQAGPTSDYDLLVLVSDETSAADQWKTAGELSFELGYQLAWPVDVIVSTPKVYRQRHDPMVETARRTGKTIYRQPDPHAPRANAAG